MRRRALGRVALTSTIYNFDVDLADQDRQVYEALALRVARHPSESDEYLWARVLAYAMEYTEGIEFSPGGLSDPDAPAIAVRDLTGSLRSWVDIGAPDAARLHKASKASPRVAVYCHKDPTQWLARLAGERIHRAHAIELNVFDRGLVAALSARLDRRLGFSVSIVDCELYVSLGQETIVGRVMRRAIEGL
jgi:uncharacterized protein YaeQ